MNTNPRVALLAVLFAGVGIAAAGCGDQSAEKVGQSVDRAASKMAATTESAADKATTVVADATITGKVKAAIFAEPGLKSLQIDVDTRNGVVTLSGSVGTPGDRERAIQLAQAIDGVASVVDHLAIKATG